MRVYESENAMTGSDPGTGIEISKPCCDRSRIVVLGGTSTQHGDVWEMCQACARKRGLLPKRGAKQVLALDFDGVLRSDSDEPTRGALKAVERYLDHFEVNVYAARSARRGGPAFMRAWLKKHGFPVHRMKFPKGKPAIHALIDDQAIPHMGRWPKVKEIRDFKPSKMRPF